MDHHQQSRCPVMYMHRVLGNRLGVAYSKVNGTAIHRQKELYNTKLHGQEFKVGDLVWLNNPVVARGASRKLLERTLYSGEEAVYHCIYRIQDTRHVRRNRQIVYFN